MVMGCSVGRGIMRSIYIGGWEGEGGKLEEGGGRREEMEKGQGRRRGRGQ